MSLLYCNGQVGVFRINNGRAVAVYNAETKEKQILPVGFSGRWQQAIKLCDDWALKNSKSVLITN